LRNLKPKKRKKAMSDKIKEQIKKLENDRLEAFNERNNLAKDVEVKTKRIIKLNRLIENLARVIEEKKTLLKAMANLKAKA